MFVTQSQMHHHHHESIAPSRYIPSVPAGEFNESNYNQQSGLSRNILFKPIGFVSNHRRSASLSGLVRRHSTRKNKSTSLSTTSSPLTIPEYVNTTTTTTSAAAAATAITNYNVEQTDLNQLSTSLNAPQPILNQNIPYCQTSLRSSHSSQQAMVHTLPIIQPRSTWGPSYEVDRRCFKINLRHPRQQVTSLLALSSIPRPVTPPFDDERENTASAILNATRTAIEEEAIRAAIAASIETENNRILSHWADQQKPSESEE